MKVLLTGANGMLARAFLNKQPRGWELRAMSKNELDIADEVAVAREVAQFSPELMINCAAYTKVDDCETNRDQAFRINGVGVGNLARAAKDVGACLVHFSTDYIFGGGKNKAYVEEDPVAPMNVYGASKWEGECAIRAQGDNHLILRTQWLYGHGGPHFVKAILNQVGKKDSIRVVDDQIGSPTWTEDLSEGTLALIERGARGTYHLVNHGACSWFDFAAQIMKESGLSMEVIPCTSAEYPRPARRPTYSVLSTAKTASLLGGPLPSWETALHRFLRSV